MAWISKHSGSTQIDRRPEPYLTDAIKQRMESEIIPRYETRFAASIPVLHAVQHEHGWIPPQAIEEVAEFLNVKPADVYDTASFYEEFALKPKGKHMIAICRSIACEVCDHAKLTKMCRDKLGIEVGETTADGRFTLMELECIGACGGAPAALFNEDLHEFVTPEDLEKLINEAD